MCLKHFEISAKKIWIMPLSHYLSTQALNWDPVLNMTKVYFELISDAGMYSFFQKGMKSGVSYTSKRYTIASNKYSKSNNPKQKALHLCN